MDTLPVNIGKKLYNTGAFCQTYPPEMIPLLELCGMAHKSGYYTPEKWETLTGVNPRSLAPKYIIITPHTELCIWTREAESLVHRYFFDVRVNYACIGIAIK